eukprot:11888278-Alexandrium_andersonii.AAC.1
MQHMPRLPLLNGGDLNCDIEVLAELPTQLESGKLWNIAGSCLHWAGHAALDLLGSWRQTAHCARLL